jgi:hypothetical protein
LVFVYAYTAETTHLLEFAWFDPIGNPNERDTSFDVGVALKRRFRVREHTSVIGDDVVVGTLWPLYISKPEVKIIEMHAIKSRLPKVASFDVAGYPIVVFKGNVRELSGEGAIRKGPSKNERVECSARKIAGGKPSVTHCRPAQPSPVEPHVLKRASLAVGLTAKPATA